MTWLAGAGFLSRTRHQPIIRHRIDCWAAGAEGTVGSSIKVRNEVLHWNGKRWSAATVPSPAGRKPGAFNELQGMSCTSARDCWADGTDGTVNSAPTLVNQAMHWNGRKWAQAATPDPDGTGAGPTTS